ncbi:MAG: hypothetical protein IJP96_04780 [Synergistaceae bacterium]|nr:hypothetical protein [Synergistaceae bacterium]MBQ6434367.1 hypothetical protein [Synergistaceae bacterium]MBR0075045.1 hypothetical protein [Synergistaceae bacterium]MBR0080863.1 hypothetical protein [Synergistaceae bacterium]MBR0233937.1 hypothetical protein [Synergistaceae bacterium]
MAKDNETKLEDILKIVISTNSKDKYDVLTEGTNTTDNSTNTSNPPVVKIQDEDMEKIGRWASQIFDALKTIKNNQQRIYDEIRRQSIRTKELQDNINAYRREIISLAGSVQGVVSTDIANCRSDIQKIIQAL